MNILQDPGHWQSYLKKYQNNKIPLAEIKRMYLQEQNQFQMQMMQMQNSLQSAQSSGASQPQIIDNPLPSECIEFVVNTTDGIFFEFTITSNVQDFSYTINWGDGVIEEGSSVSLNAFLNHTYPEGIAEYTVRICFSDPSIINTINFPGFD